MSSYDKYEARMRKDAILDGLENGLRDGGKCLICRCWRKPCASCSAAAGNGRHKDGTATGKSWRYQQAAARLG